MMKDKVINITYQLKGQAAEDFKAMKSDERFTFIESDAAIAKKLMLERVAQLKTEPKPEAEAAHA